MYCSLPFVFLVSIRSLGQTGPLQLTYQDLGSHSHLLSVPSPTRTPNSSPKGSLHYKRPGACVCGRDGCGALWNLSEASDSAGEAISLGTFRSGFCAWWFVVLFCKRNFIPWRHFVHICNDFIKKKKNSLCASSQRPLRFHFLLEGLSPKTMGGSGCTHQPFQGQKAHTPSCLSCSWEHPKRKDGLSSTLGLSKVRGTCPAVQGECTEASFMHDST